MDRLLEQCVALDQRVRYHKAAVRHHRARVRNCRELQARLEAKLRALGIEVVYPAKEKVHGGSGQADHGTDRET
jgi:hypothetical protein